MENRILARKRKRLINTQVKRLQSRKALEADDIHKLRVLTKKLRAYLRLYPGDKHIGLKNRMDRSVKQISRELSGLRDNYVLNERLEKLFQELAIIPGGHINIEQPHPPAEHKIKTKRIARKLKKLATQWKKLAKANPDDKFRKGLRKSYRINQSLGLAALQSSEDTRFHKWRKWVKYWLYQSNLLPPKQRRQNSEYFSRLRELGSLLGDYHDYCILELTLQKSTLSPQNQEIERALLKLLADKKSAQHRAFEKEYDYLFGKKFSKLDFA